MLNNTSSHLLRILFYVPQMAPYGGLESHVCSLAQRAAARGHSIRFLTTSNSLNPGARASLATAGIDFRELPATRGSASAARKLAWLWRQTLAARLSHWDIIYTNGQSALASVPWSAARTGTRIIHHHHTAADIPEQTTWSPRYRQLLHRARELVGCSEITRHNLVRALATRTGATPVFLPYFSTAPLRTSDIADIAYREDSLLHFGFIGRLVSTKGIEILCSLSLRPELSNIVWHIHGAGPDYPPDFFADYPAIRYHGPYHSSTDYAQILEKLDAVVLYSQHNEGMPVSLLEAMSAGLPWVATDRGGTRELFCIAPKNTSLISADGDEAHALAATLDLASRIRKNTTSRAAQRAAYDTRFSPETVAREWFGYFENAPTSPTTITISPAHRT